MHLKNTDKDWEYFGRTDPYFGVLTWDEYKKENLSPESRRTIFQTGAAHIESIFKVVHGYLDASFEPINATTLDFGCGVGRLVIPLARVCKRVTGVDISESMLSEAGKNCQEYGLSNVDFIKDLDDASGSYDFIHSYIVLQHIPVKRGEMIVKQLIGLLRENGIGVLHLTYYRDVPSGSRFRYWLYTHFPNPVLIGLWNVLRGRPFEQPVMQMNEYDLNQIFRILQESGCHHNVVRFTQHGETYGVIVFFQKKAVGLLF